MRKPCRNCPAKYHGLNASTTTAARASQRKLSSLIVALLLLIALLIALHLYDYHHLAKLWIP